MYLWAAEGIVNIKNISFNGSGDTVFQLILLGNVVWSSDKDVNLIGSPKRISFKGDNFTGGLEYQILKK